MWVSRQSKQLEAAKAEEKAHEAYRRELWVRVWVAYAAAGNSTNATRADTWADHALKEFDSRFNSPRGKTNVD